MNILCTRKIIVPLSISLLLFLGDPGITLLSEEKLITILANNTSLSNTCGISSRTTIILCYDKPRWTRTPVCFCKALNSTARWVTMVVQLVLYLLNNLIKPLGGVCNPTTRLCLGKIHYKWKDANARPKINYRPKVRVRGHRGAFSVVENHRIDLK